MIIGNGLIAQAFHQYTDDKKVLIFASGVSSSKSCTVFDCRREESLIRKALTDNSNQTLFVYFSSCSISSSNLKNDLYHTHKKKMEGIIHRHSNRNIIFRLSNVVGKINNPSTLLPYLFNKIKSQEKFNLWHGVKRNIIDIDDVVAISNYIIQNNLFKNEIVNIANLTDNMVNDIVSEISKYLGIGAEYSIIEHSDNFYIDTTKIEPIVKHLGLSFDVNYLKGVIVKYCKKK
jgi:nucleoside-diphosphate-sugar epimerase